MSTEAEPAAADRVAELRENLAAVRARIAGACDRAGRDPAEITLIAVTKTFPASDVRLLAGLGITDVGENRDQEAAPKAAACEAYGLSLRWHFIGQLQVNKCASVVRYCEVVHSVDRSKLVRALAGRAEVAGRVITCLIQVSLDDAAGRGGADPAQVPDLASEIAADPSLRLGGVMAVAPLGRPARPAFARLRKVAKELRSAHPGASVISAGMSGDLDDAIAEGATHVRVGTALLGGRPGFVR
ncbi:MAG: YggS family pyridoxal phosphate-dependent enzyme [Streptosporangiaceae bacterium]